MGNITINNTVLEKYFEFLERLDNNAKKKLIIKLTESLEFERKDTDLKSLFGAWEDARGADEIIKEIRNIRVNNREIENS